MNDRKPYRSALREQQAEATRARIIEAALAEMTPGATELPFDKVAARVPVSVRTVYRYFPTQRDLQRAAGAELEARAGFDPEQVTAENLAALTRELYVFLEKTFGPQEATGGFSNLTETGQKARERRVEMIERAIAPLTEGMDPEKARGAMAVISGMVRLPFLAGMQAQWGLDGEQAGRAVEWAINALLDDLQRRD
jgi:AcrR family transcriptional regulator